MPPTADNNLTAANRLGLDYRVEAERLPHIGPLLDVHVHLQNVEAAELFFEAADAYHVRKVWSMTQLEELDAMRDRFGERIDFIALPNHTARETDPGAFTTDWLRRIEAFANKGVRICKFWSAPRGRDWHPDALRIDSPMRFEQMRLARSLGMMFMAHIADPDTWFATHYRDSARYGSKADHYDAFRRALDEFGDVTWLAAHMAGSPEDLDRLQGLLDTYPRLHLDTSATKWMVRELSRHAPGELADFLRRNSGRILFGSDVVAMSSNMDFDLYASRYWALRTLFETDYVGPSPIVDPDLPLVNPELPDTATADLRGLGLDAGVLTTLYHDAAANLLPGGDPRS
ncbi:MAG: hypothetical protein WD009_04490 [Phycisphaeraceae bacterium]